MIDIDTQFKDISAATITSDILRVVVILDQGGNIASLYDLRDDRELLWQGQGKLFRRTRPGALYRDGECAGIDDMFPNAAACIIEEGFFTGRKLPDHGEVWTLPCKVEVQADETLCLTMRGQCLPYRMKKRISLKGASLRIDYCVENQSSHSFPFLWAAHPQFRAAEFVSVLVPGFTGHLTLPFCFGKKRASGPMCYPRDQWADQTTIDFRRIPKKQEKIGYKFLLSTPLKTGKCLLVGKAGKRDLEITFPVHKIPFLGVWVDANSDESAPAYVIAPEPSTHVSIDLNERASFRPNELQAYDCFEWWVEYSIV